MGLGLGLGHIFNNSSPTGSFELTNLSGLKLWLKYDTGITLNGSSVSSWADQSGESNNAAQATSSRQPNYGSGDIRFDGTDDRFDLTSQISLSSFSTFMVINPDATASMGVFGSASNQCIRVHQGGDADRVTVKGVAGDSDQLNLTQDLPQGNFLLSVTRNGGGSTDNVRVFINTTDVTDTARDSMIPAPLTVNTVGSCTAAFLPFDGTINELAIYNTLLTGDEISDVQNNIMSRNGL
ncbi:MAG: hypothetical protein CMI60_21190 [Parvibaculum sp.]|nr:hypothetical protein [Parvibaculum sp.]